MDQNDYFVTAPTTPTHFPDNHNHRPDVQDIYLLQIANMQFNIKNLNELSSDHNPIILNLFNQTFLQLYKIKTQINWKNFSVKLHKYVTNPNPAIRTISDLDEASENLINLFKSILDANTTTHICNPHKDLLQAIYIALIAKKRLHRIWQRTKNPEVKRRLNNMQSAVVRKMFRTNHEDEWNNQLGNLKPNNPKIFKITKGYPNKRPPSPFLVKMV